MKCTCHACVTSHGPLQVVWKETTEVGCGYNARCDMITWCVLVHAVYTAVQRCAVHACKLLSAQLVLQPDFD